VITIHDACPAFSTKIFESVDELERLNIKFNIALIPFFNYKQDLPRFPEFVDKIKSYKNCQIVLHGLYHELKNGQFDNFHETTEADAEEQIRAAIEIFHEIGIETKVFIPPAWKLNNRSIKVLEKLGFKLAEEQEEYLMLLSQQQQGFKKIKLPKVLNWDSTGYPEKNIVNMGRDERAFKLQIEKRPQIIRIALHPRDPEEAIKDQKQMISILKDSAYEISTYTELIPRLEELAAPPTQLD
jgi:peptidoglycan/xylan/chitin deacetylase (PgdA/CDA1 family)